MFKIFRKFWKKFKKILNKNIKKSCELWFLQYFIFIAWLFLFFCQAFKLHLIENALQILVKPGCQLNSLNGDQALRKTKIPDVLSYVQLIMENSVLWDLNSPKSPATIIGRWVILRKTAYFRSVKYYQRMIKLLEFLFMTVQ